VGFPEILMLKDTLKTFAIFGVAVAAFAIWICEARSMGCRKRLIK
jgi:hypothetical protein